MQVCCKSIFEPERGYGGRWRLRGGGGSDLLEDQLHHGHDDGGDDGGDDVDNEKSTYGGFFSLCGVPRLPCEHLLVSSDKGLRVNDDHYDKKIKYEY